MCCALNADVLDSLRLTRAYLQEEEYMWQRGHRQGGHFLNPRGEYNPEYNPGHQDVAWSGDVLPPYHIGEGPPPPQQPFQGEPSSSDFACDL